MTQSSFTAGDITWSSETIKQCNSVDFTEFANQNILGMFGKSDATTTKSITNLPPHWSVSIRFDFILYQSLDSDDYIDVKIDGLTQSFQKSGASSGYYFCVSGNTYKDELLLYYKNITHTSNTISISLIALTDEPITNEGFGIKNFLLYVDTCHESCLTCNGPTENQCVTCPANSTKSGNKCICNSGFYPTNNSCLSSCPIGQIKDQTGKFCVDDFCYSLICQTCTNNICSACKSGYFLLNGQCVKSCPSYSTPNGQKCIDQISKTSYGKYLYKGMFSDRFGEGEIVGSGLSCSGFLGKQSNPSGALTTICDGKTVFGGAYLSSKGAIITSSFTGLQPHWSVLIGYTLYKIDSWDNEQFKMEVDGVNKQITTKAMGDGAGNICGKVSYKDEIINVAQNFTHTSTSINLRLINNLDGDPFDESFGIRELYILVDYCSPNCATCDNTGCLTCLNGYYLYDHQCVSACPNGTSSDSNKICQPCHTSCSTCSSPSSSTSCLTCKSNTYLNPNQSCQSTCPSKYWGQDSDWTCKNCDSTCYNCKNPGDSSSCTSCSGSLYLQNKQCVSVCNPGTFKLPQTNNNICQSCNSQCKTCDGPNSNNCLSCQAPNLFYQQSTKSCVTSCDLREYKNTNTQECSPCNTLCYTCFGPNDNNCISCSGTNYLDQQIKKCVNICPPGTFKLTQTNNNICQPCNSQCKTCDGPNNDNCLSCQAPNLFYQQSTKSCVTSCDQNEFKNTNTQECSPCNSLCLSCFGPNDDNCLSCSAPNYLDKQMKKCVSVCPPGTFKLTQTNNNICQPCNSQCLTCDGPNSNNCLSCLAPKLFYQQSTKSCVTSCDLKEYKNTTSQICSPCNPPCLSCFGPNDNNCLSCTDPKFLDEQLNKCVLDCPLKYYKDKQSQKCLACDTTCYTCDGSSHQNCLSCQLETFFEPNSKQCVDDCNSNQYKDRNSIECKPCDSNCLTCSGPSSSNCLSCRQGLFLQNNQCIQKCNDSFYGQINPNICKGCDPACLSCSGPSNTECLSCQKSLILLNSTCFDECPNGYYKYKSLINNECRECHYKCKSGCDGPLAEDCKSIQYKYQLMFFILIIKCVLWIASSTLGYFIDKRQTKIYSQNQSSPLPIFSDRINDKQSPFDDNSQLKQKEEIEKSIHQLKIDSDSQKLNSGEFQTGQTQAQQFQRRVGNRRPRQKFNKNKFLPQLEIQFNNKMKGPEYSTTAATLPNIQEINTVSSSINKQEIKISSLPFIKKYTTNQIMKYSIEMNGFLCFTFMTQSLLESLEPL